MCSDQVFAVNQTLRQTLVIDTNIVLDLFLFDDAPVLRTALQRGQVAWLATPDMREELARVLSYPSIVLQQARFQRSAQQILQGFDDNARLMPVPMRASILCEDADDQKFLDLAVAHQAALLSKDQALLRLAKRLSCRGVSVKAKFSDLSATLTCQTAT